MDQYNPYGQNQVYPPGQEPSNGLGIASLVLGIVSLVCIFFGVYAFIGVACAIVGLILGIRARKENPTSAAKAGFVLNAIGLSVCAVTFIGCLACVGCLAAAS